MSNIHPLFEGAVLAAGPALTSREVLALLGGFEDGAALPAPDPLTTDPKDLLLGENSALAEYQEYRSFSDLGFGLGQIHKAVREIPYYDPHLASCRVREAICSLPVACLGDEKKMAVWAAIRLLLPEKKQPESLNCEGIQQ